MCDQAVLLKGVNNSAQPVSGFKATAASCSVMLYDLLYLIHVSNMA